MFKNFNKKAFSLIELLLYIASVSVFSLLILNYFSSVQNKLIIDSKKDDLIIQNSIVLDLLRRDLYSASWDLNDWDEQNFVFRKKLLDGSGKFYMTCIGFSFDKNGTKRIEGEYNFVTHKWLKKTSSIINYNFINCELKLDKQKNRLVEIFIKLKNNAKKK
ncbi:type II secretion system GspH family protein [Candidatus Babeliales bacterium]|nr:type II secretion system GspH family protein [Candidatus Babeliales bacterium]